MTTVFKFKDCPCPPINENALKITNRFLKEFYIYGGTRWAGNDNTESPTCEWNSDFFCLSLVSFQWKEYRVGAIRVSYEFVWLRSLYVQHSIREDPANLMRSPVHNAVLGSKSDHMKKLPKLGTLPAIKNPIGALFQYNDAYMTSYLFILGDLDDPSRTSPLLLCIDMRMCVWGEVQMTGHHRLHTGRAHASMIFVGEPGTDQFYLCVFGGEDEDVSNITLCLAFTRFMVSPG